MKKEAALIILLSLADLVTTILWVKNSGAEEANPLFAPLLQAGVGWLILGKFLFVLGPLLILAYCHQFKPRFVKAALYFAIVAYIGLYSWGVCQLNQLPRPIIVAPQRPKTAIGIARAQARHLIP